MSKEEKLELISKEILLLKRKKIQPKEPKRANVILIKYKLGISIISIISTVLVSSFSMLSLVYVIYRDKIILWSLTTILVIISIIVFRSFFINYGIRRFNYSIRHDNKKIDEQIELLKMKYHQVKKNINISI